MHRVLLFFLFAVFALPVSAQTVNVGFVQGIWYSEEPVFVGVPTRVYVAFRNNTGSDFTGTIVFHDNDKRIGSSYVSVLSGRIVEAWTDWTPTAGDHDISVSVANASLHEVGKKPKPLDIASIVSEDSLSVDHDTDGDKIGNLEDADDDGDGVSDEDESARGTNPLVKDATPEAASAPAPLPVPVPASKAASSEAEGLEQFLPEGAASGAVSKVTEGIRAAKQSLDEYRASRSTETATSANEETLSGENATITRSRIDENPGVFGALWGGVKVILSNIYSVLLWFVSKVLAHPAFVELILLLGLLYGFYRIARRIGSRPNW